MLERGAARERPRLAAHLITERWALALLHGAWVLSSSSLCECSCSINMQAHADALERPQMPYGLIAVLASAGCLETAYLALVGALVLVLEQKH